MTARPMITRSVPLLDLERRGADKRTVVAYVATFGNEYEVRDEYGHYDETINRTAFNRTLKSKAQVFPIFNHGRTPWGTPSEKWMTPLGVPEEITPDGRGLLTVTRYNKTAAADEVLELLDSGSVTTHSFRGPVFRSSPARRGVNGRPVIERTELGLKEYGPGMYAVNTEAGLVAIRTQLLADEVGEMTPEERRDLIALLQQSLDAEVDPAAAPDSPQEQPVDAPSAPAGPDTSLLQLANDQRRRR